MSTLPEINILPLFSKAGGAAGLKSGKSKGNDMFQSILDSLNGRNSDSTWFSSLYSDNNLKNSFKSVLGLNSKNIKTRVGLHGKNLSGNSLLKNKHNSEDLIVPASLQNQLVTFLEKQGFSLKDINQVLSTSKNSNGFIRLDKLLTGLSNINPAGNKQGTMLVASFKDVFSSFLNEQGIDLNNFGTFFSSLRDKNSVLAGKINDLLTGAQKDNSYIESSQIPAVQEILFNMGLGVGNIKKVVEMSKNGNGELELGKLSAKLNKFLPKPFSGSDLASIFSKNNISINERLFNTNKADKSNLSGASAINLTDKSQKVLKQNIETMLREQGIQDKNIKSILEKINIAFEKTLLEKNTVSGETDPNNHKILNILEGEKQVISKVLGDPVKEDIAAFLKKNASSDKEVKSFLDSFSLNIKKANIGQGENYLKSSMLNGKAFLLSKNDQFLSTADQGNLKLNLSEMIKLAEKKSEAPQLLKTESNNQPATALKNSLPGKEKSEFNLKETQNISGLDILQEKEIKNIGKVNQANTPANLSQALPKIVDKIMIMIRTGEYKGRIKITPPDLGKLDIDLTIKNGHIHANLSTENAAVKEIIEANLNQLKQQLNNQGLTVDGFDVMVGLDNGKREESNTWAEGRNGKYPGRNTGTKSVNTEEILASQPVEKDLISDSQIDVHV
jgi:flagellar hook-length control protein FliK